MATLLIVFGIIGFFLPVALIVAIILFATRKSETSFQHKMDTIYSYIVLIVTIVLIIFSLIGLIYTFADIIIPPDYVNNEISSDYINEQYVQLITFIGVLAISSPIFIEHKKRIETNKQK